MKLQFPQKKIFVTAAAVVSLILAGFHIIDLRNPKCADAQTCVNVMPQVMYFETNDLNWVAGQMCSPPVTHTSPAFAFPLTTGRIALALTGWHLYYPNEHQDWLEGRVEIIQASIRAAGNSVQFEYRVCLTDNDSTSNHRYQLRFMAFAWP